jgi:SAM-dependent methyltransferase
VAPQRFHYRDRARAESFGAVAADYDRYRPGYPTELIDDLVALRPRAVLDVGCGTGKAAQLMAARGLNVLGVEIDPEMAAVARGHGIDVEVGSFEDWDDAGRRFDLITSAQAWHWVEPRAGAAKAARLLEPGGALALFWNFSDLDAPARAVVAAVYARLAPEVRTVGTGNDPGSRLAELQDTGVFGSVETTTYPWRRSVTVDDWVGAVATHSDHLLLGAQRLATVTAALRAALREAGDEVHLTGGTYTIWARL